MLRISKAGQGLEENMKEAAQKLSETEGQQAQLVTSLMDLKTEVERQVQVLIKKRRTERPKWGWWVRNQER